MFGSTRRGQITLAFERWGDVEAAIAAIGRGHYEEVEGEMAKKKPYKLKLDVMRHLDNLGILRCMIARDGGAEGPVVGYCLWQVTPDIESDCLIAKQGPLWASPTNGHGSLAYHMIRKSIPTLRRLGVTCLFLHHRTAGRGIRLSLWFRRLAATLIQHEYFLWIGD